MKQATETCSATDHHGNTPSVVLDAHAIERCARIFRSLGDAPRLRIITRLAAASACVGELAEAEGETVATISQRLRVLRAENVVTRKRDGKHVLYSLADRHMHDLVANGLEHATEHPRR